MSNGCTKKKKARVRIVEGGGSCIRICRCAKRDSVSSWPGLVLSSACDWAVLAVVRCPATPSPYCHPSGVVGAAPTPLPNARESPVAECLPSLSLLSSPRRCCRSLHSLLVVPFIVAIVVGARSPLVRHRPSRSRSRPRCCCPLLLRLTCSPVVVVISFSLIFSGSAVLALAPVNSCE